MTPEQAEVWALLQRINDAWVRGRPAEMSDLLHESFVILPPGAPEPVRGREAAVDSYRDFLVQATVVRFEERPLSIDIFGAAAVVTYDFELTYGLGGKWTTDRGREVWVFAREGGAWTAVWRTQYSG
jgi:hypothetical protein